MQDTSKLPYVNYEGNFVVNDLSLFDSEHNQCLVEWGAFQTTRIYMVSIPFSVKIDEIVINKLFAPIILDPTIDIVKALRSIPGAVKNLKIEIEKLTNTPQKDFHFDIGEIKIENSEIVLTDLSLPQKFTADIHSLNGDISGFSKDKPLGTLLQADGLVEKDGKAKIEGKIDLFDPLAYAILTVNFQNIDLTNFTPYTMKFLGYKVTKGKLSLDLQYQIKNEMLVADNKIYLNKLTLGDKVEQADALDFPVETAISILKDKDGNIDLDLEIKGNLNDPEIAAGTLIWWAVKRSFTSVIEAPFVYLGELLGINSDDLEYIAFSPGESTLLPNQIESLANLNKAMNERPNITIEIYGSADTVTDAQEIRSRKLKDAFTKRMITGAADSLVDPLKVEVSISRNILETMYVEKFGSKKLDSLLVKYSLQVNQSNNNAQNENDLRNYLQEMINHLEDKQPVSHEEIINLANERTVAIRNHMITVQQVNPARLVAKEPEIYEQKDSNWVKCRLGIGSL